jgi:CRP-like cAMP-binding protein
MDRLSIAVSAKASSLPSGEGAGFEGRLMRAGGSRSKPGRRRDSLDQLFSRIGRHRSRTDLVSEGVRPDRCWLILDGWACRYRVLHDGRRSVIAFLMPGDMCGFWLDGDGTMDHGVGTLCELTSASVSAGRLLDALARSPDVAATLRGRALDARLLLADWLVNIGRADSHHRLARLIGELWGRAGAAALIRNGALDLPITQELLADALGLTTVHVNRTVRTLRELGLIEWRAGRLRVPDPGRLRAEARHVVARSRR